jgi:predicted lipase
MNMKFAMAEFVNPITEDYYGRSSHFGLHTGFSLYLSRQRKDDSNTKIEEIFSMINEIGRAIAPDGDYELSITGHSLGGALATLLSFYAATSSMFENLKTIRVFTFAAPRVGCIR